MFLSISVTTYNRRKLSEYCIRSIYERTSKEDYELIVIDNGSTDGTVEMLKDYRAVGAIDKLILNHRNNLASAINDAWRMASSKADWLYAVSNDIFVMEGWIDNLKRVVTDLKPDLVYATLRMTTFYMKKYLKTENGGFYVQDIVENFRSHRGGIVIPKSLVEKHNLYFLDDGDSSPWGIKEIKKGHKRKIRQVSIYSYWSQKANDLGLKWVELGKPCALWQDCEFANPEYEEYYSFVYGIRNELRKFKNLKRQGGYIRYPEQYYKGSDYEIGEHWKEILNSKEGKLYWDKLGYESDFEEFLSRWKSESEVKE